MKFWVGVTDNKWYKFLSQLQPDEVNFWQPSGTAPFTNAPVGLPFLFKLKRPHHHIAGGGFFVTYSSLPINIVWEVFGHKNGCSSLSELYELIAPLKSTGRVDGQIGCTVLANPFFFDQPAWINDIPGWSSNIVRGKMYDSTEAAGAELWQEVEYRMASESFEGEINSPPVAAEPSKNMDPRLQSSLD